LLQGNPVFKEMELIYKTTLKADGTVNTDLKDKVEQVVQELNAEDYTLFLSIELDFIKSNDVKTILERIEEERKKAKAAADEERRRK
jgi:hypothetical protein